MADAPGGAEEQKADPNAEFSQGVATSSVPHIFLHLFQSLHFVLIALIGEIGRIGFLRTAVLIRLRKEAGKMGEPLRFGKPAGGRTRIFDMAELQPCFAIGASCWRGLGCLEV
jgi:hypothetical protein